MSLYLKGWALAFYRSNNLVAAYVNTLLGQARLEKADPEGAAELPKAAFNTHDGRTQTELDVF